MTIRRRYDKKYLYKHIEDKEIELIGEYENVNKDIITGNFVSV